MKQTISILMAMVAMMLFSTSCDKSSLIEQNPSGEVIMQTVTISAGISSDAQTKTYIGDEVTEEVGGELKKFRKVFWSEGDVIGVMVLKDGATTLDGIVTVDDTPISEGGKP